MQLYMSHDTEEMGILQEAEAIAFIKQALRSISGDSGAEITDEQALNLFHAMQSLDPSYMGINLDDFISTIKNMAAWRVKGRTEDDIVKPISLMDRVKVMIESSFNATKASIDNIRNEVEVQRL